MDACVDEGRADIGRLGEEELGSGLKNGLDVNFRIEISNNSFLFP